RRPQRVRAYLIWISPAFPKKKGGVNRHNYHYYSDANSHWQRSQEFQRQWSINVWAGILGDVIV
ncbi:hypothetical protein EAI_12203, partial [Harpegnathos saltator]